MAEYYTFEQLREWRDFGASLSPPARLAVVGDPIGHSKSPQMHNPALRAAGIDAQYVRVQVPVGRVAEAFRLFQEHGFYGVNVTIPHKFEALEAVDEADALARQLGAVNTVVMRDGLLLGRNTDGPGFLQSVREAFGRDIGGMRVLILGAGGGAGRAVAVQCALAGARVILANRTRVKAELLREEIDAMGVAIPPEVAHPTEGGWCTPGDAGMAELIVNATPLGMKESDEPLLPPGWLRADQMVYDMVYRAGGETPLIREAREVGAAWADGMSMLLHQGALAFEHWFGRPAPLEAMREGLREAGQRM